MENSIEIFSNPQFGKIRTAGTADNPLFCLADICKAVELQNPSSVKRRLDEEDVQLIDLHALNSTNPGNAVATFVTESGFYDVLLYSSSSSVRPFRRWVTSEVLPSIRKTGGYQIPQTFSQALMLAAKQAEIIEIQQKELTVARPKAEYFDGLVERNLLTNFRDTAHQLGLKQKEFIELLLKNGFVYRDKKSKLKPYQEYMPKWFKINDWKKDEKAGSQTLITPEGKEAFRLMFRKEVTHE